MSNTIVSFDVGIRNLAYCIIRVIPFEIEAWGIINLVDSPPVCATIRRKRACNKRAAYLPPTGCGDTQPICAKCAATHPIWLIPDKKYRATTLSALSAVELADRLRVLQPDAEECNDSKRALVANIVAVYATRMFVPISATVSASSANMISVARSIARTLDADPRFAAVQCVLIESQIGPLANRMKAVQGMLTQYFVLRGNADIHYISSANKLKLFVAPKEAAAPAVAIPPQSGGEGEGEGAVPPTPASQTKQYAQRKAASVIHTRCVLEQTPAFRGWLDVFDASPKKDDYADCFLQLLWYLRTARTIAFEGYHCSP